MSRDEVRGEPIVVLDEEADAHDEIIGPGAPPSAAEIEGLADEFLARAGLRHQRRVESISAQVALRVPVVREAPQGTSGWCQPNAICIPRGTPRLLLPSLLGYELSRWFLTQKGIHPIAQRVILPQFQIAWQAPAHGVRCLRAAAHGFAFAVRGFVYSSRDLASPCDILVRAAALCNVVLVLQPGRGQPFPVAPPGYERNLRLDPDVQRTLIDKARDSRGPVYVEQGAPGVLAVSFRDGDRRGVALVLSDVSRLDEPDDTYRVVLDEAEGWDRG